MFVIHAHWQPPKRPDETGGILFWAETSTARFPVINRGRPGARRPTGKEHPFCFPAEELQQQIGEGTPLADAIIQSVRLQLPTGHSGPVPSPALLHNYRMDLNGNKLSTWTVKGLWLPTSKAFGVLTNLPESGPDGAFVLGEDLRYWRKISNLIMEVMAGQKMLPVLIQTTNNAKNNRKRFQRRWRGRPSPKNVVENNSIFYARWMPILDGPSDAPRLVQLAKAMPPVCRAQAPENGNPEPASRQMLDSFLNTVCDALMRTWTRSAAPRNNNNNNGEKNPAQAWLSALFGDDPVVHASEAQLMALGSTLRAWMRNLNASGDSVYRIAFQLVAPDEEGARPEDKIWQLNYFLQARDDPSLFIPAQEVWRKGASQLNQLGRVFDQPQEKLLAGLGYAARLFPPILPGLQSSTPTGIQINTPQTYTFLRETAPLLDEAGFGLMVPPWWNKPGTRLGVKLHIQPKENSSPTTMNSMLGLRNLVNYQWELSIGGTALTRREFETLVALKQPLVQIRGQWVQLDPEQIEAAIKFWENKEHSGEMSLLQAAQYSLGGDPSGDLKLTEVEAEGWIAEWIDRLKDHDRVNELPQPASLNGILRPYQRFGYSWLAFFRRWGMGACLADDMGLGKTIQALSLLLYEKETLGKLDGPVLLICPTSVVLNWEREVRRFAPQLTTLIHQGPGRLRGEEFTEKCRETDLVLTSYAVSRLDAETLQQTQWYGVILDEAQNIKNASAKQSVAVRKLPANFRFALTGTPVENRLSELWSIMQFLNPGFLGSQENFRREYAIPIERFGDKEATKRLKNLVSPFILRRVKTDPRVIQDLPDKIEMKEYINLSEEQATIYEAAVKEALTKVEEATGIERKGQVLTLLLHLKQICNHPEQFLQQMDETAPDLSLIKNRSGKLNRLVEMLDEIVEENQHALIFTQFARMGHLLAAYLPKALSRPVLYLHGGTPIKTREQIVKRFQEETNGPPVLILSLKAGGTGLNLTRASHVFHFDRWWNPAVEDQATDRAFRIGQNKNVEVHKFITNGTLEEKIDELIEAKKGLADSIIGGAEQWLTELSTDELRELVKLRRS
jgi:SNF2 family DNA or RNA helicase